jgi:hypothetical protein
MASAEPRDVATPSGAPAPKPVPSAQPCGLETVVVTYDLASISGREAIRVIAQGILVNSRRPVRTLVVRNVIFLVWLAAVGFLVGLPASPNMRPEAMALCFALFGLLVLFRTFMNLRKSARRLRAAGRLVVEFSAEGITRRMENRVVSIAWPGVREVDVTRQDVVFRFQQGDLFWMPRRAIGSAAAEGAVLALIRNCLSEAGNPGGLRIEGP